MKLYENEKNSMVAVLIDQLRSGSRYLKMRRVDPDWALSRLQSITGQDFGHDAKAWKKWLSDNPNFELKDDNL